MESAERGWRDSSVAGRGGNSGTDDCESEVAGGGACGAAQWCAVAGNSALGEEVDRCTGGGAADWGGASGGIVSSGSLGEEYIDRSVGAKNGWGGISICD